METNNLEQLVEELKTVLPFKNTTDIGDIVIIMAQTPQTIVYAQVTSIERDTSKREEWWHLGLTVLSLPMQKVVWTLRTEQMTGQEIFTMGGEKRFFQAVDTGLAAPRRAGTDASDTLRKGGLKRIK